MTEFFVFLFVIGYGVGTWSAIRGKSWWLARQKAAVQP